MEPATWADDAHYDYVKPGKVAWTRVSRFIDKRPSAGLIAAPMDADAALENVIDFLVHERGWRVVSRTDRDIRLRKIWNRRERIDPFVLVFWILLGVFPALIYLLVASIPGKPVRGEMTLSVAASDGEETIIEFAGGPYPRVKRSVDAVAQALWMFDAEPLFA